MLSIDNPADIPFIPQDAINQTTRPKVFIKQIVPLGTGTFAPYGYIKDPAHKKRLIIDPEAAEIVRRILFPTVR